MANYASSAFKLSDTYVNTLPYNTCSTAAGTAAKTVSAGTFSLETGAMVVVKFTVTNTAANPTLNVSSTGAKAIYYNGAAITAGYLKANKIYQFIYNGTQWDLVGDVDTNTTYTSLKNPNALTVKGNGTQSFTYDGSAAKTLNIKAGTNVSVSSDTSGNITISATDTVYTHPNSGVTAGTYKSVTVNAQGHVTSGSNPTTLAGYGITDAETIGTASSAVSTHNTSTSAHNDIRDLIAGLTNRLNALADSDDTTLNQLSEIVAYIKNNKSLIDGITTSKVNVSDIVNNLTTNVTNKPLSAAQGVAIKALIDALQETLDEHTHTKSEITDFPTSMRNPYALTIDGISYNGSSAVDVATPKAFYITVTDASGGKFNADKTLKEIVAAYENGRPMFALYGDICHQLANYSGGQISGAPTGAIAMYAEFKNISAIESSEQTYNLNTHRIDISGNYYQENEDKTVYYTVETREVVAGQYINHVNSQIDDAIAESKYYTDTTYTFNGAVSTIKDSNLTVSRALVSNSSGKVAVSAVTADELGYLDGVTSGIQAQLNSKVSTSSVNSLELITVADIDEICGASITMITEDGEVEF